jgi:hypothetical protein
MWKLGGLGRVWGPRCDHGFRCAWGASRFGWGWVLVAGPVDRPWSWVATGQERDERVGHARRLVGLVLQAVRYVDIDYFRAEVAAGHVGPRRVTAAAEWREPVWCCAGFDSVDYGIELQMRGGRVFSVTWDPPGMREGIGVRELPLLGTGVRADAGVAIWDVGDRGGWAGLLGADVTDVRLHYASWRGRGGGFWCPRITIRVGGAAVELLLGQAGPDGQLHSAADNVAVLFDPARLPDWDQTTP